MAKKKATPSDEPQKDGPKKILIVDDDAEIVDPIAIHVAGTQQRADPGVGLSDEGQIGVVGAQRAVRHLRRDAGIVLGGRIFLVGSAQFENVFLTLPNWTAP